MALQPLSDYVVATAEAAQTQTASGIYLPETAAEKPKSALVESVGPDVKQVKKGDRIIYKSYSTTDLKLEGTEYIIVKEEDIIATVK